ncbi:MAG TPA: UbiX family flavin prenyltransferase [Ilumatobacter sp.]|nr:UbiX family flavin prenyltransferase [Ilumatobacter sp.]
MRIVIGISGASGAIYGVRLLEVLAAHSDVETHLVVSRSARLTIPAETDRSIADVESLADHLHHYNDIGAPIASGSFRADAMIVAPCSMKTASAIAHSYADNLIVRAADVMLKERRPVVLMARETPLHAGHLRVLAEAAQLGAVIAPPMPAFYQRPATIGELVDHSVGRVLDLLGIEAGLVRRWAGLTSPEPEVPLAAAPATGLAAWAVSRYGADGVRATCLALQDEHGVDVVALLALWWALSHGRATGAALDDWVAGARQHGHDVVAPLRQARRAIPAGPLHDQVAAAELAAELEQLERLGATAPPPPDHAGPPETLVDAAMRLLVEHGDRDHAATLLRTLADDA